MKKDHSRKIAALKDLIQSEGWKIVTDALREDLEITEKKLYGELPMDEHETIEGLRTERIDRLELIGYPENTIRELVDEEREVTMDDLEAYETEEDDDPPLIST